jgi:hypothetical protein
MLSALTLRSVDANNNLNGIQRITANDMFLLAILMLYNTRILIH